MGVGVIGAGVISKQYLDNLTAFPDLKVYVIADLFEDAAEAHGASYKGRPVGGLGRAAMFSFTPTKNITTGEGGIVTTDDGSLAARLRLLRNHGQTSQYEHAFLGHNWRMTEMQAYDIVNGRVSGDQPMAQEINNIRKHRMKITLAAVRRQLDALATVRGRKSLILMTPGFLQDDDQQIRETAAASRLGSTHPARGKWQVYPFG